MEIVALRRNPSPDSAQLPRTLVAFDGGVWFWPGIPLTTKRGDRVLPAPADSIQFWISALHGRAALTKPLVSAVGRAALLLENANQTAAQAILDRAGLDRVTPEGIVLMRAVAQRLAVGVPAVPILDRYTNKVSGQAAWMAPHFDRFGHTAAKFEKIGGIWDSSKHPRWPAGADASQGGQFAPSSALGPSRWGLNQNPLVSPIDYSDGFHDVVVRAWVDTFRAAGIPVVERPALRFIGPDDSVIGYPDLLIHVPGHGVEAIEVKTGMDPPLTSAQRWYYPVLQVGNHLYSDDFRVAQLGLVPGEPFPPMMVHRIYTPGPGKPYVLDPLPPPVFVP
ncbi:MAG TPA: hypothetical protein VKQ29_15150 [Aliidongia sp.]|nr:hypothetical protein [Aliidongia sp.]